MNKKEAIQYLGNLVIPPMTSNLPEAVTEHQKYIDALRIAQQSLQNEINLIIEFEKIKAEIREWYWQADKQKISQDPCVVDAMTDLFIRTVDKRISELKGESNG